MKALSPSKINLTLEILGIKENQYHEISSIMQTLDLSDEMSFNLSSDISVTTDNEMLSNDICWIRCCVKITFCALILNTLDYLIVYN